MFIKNITGYEGYKIHQNGFVISYKYNKPRILKTGISKKGEGYRYVNLMKDGKYHTEFIHLLVAKHFLKDYDCSLQVNHIDGVKTHNNLRNIEMVTQSQNLKHAVKLGLLTPYKGEDHWCSKLTWEKVHEIRNLYKTGNYTQSEIAGMYGVSQSQASNIITMRNWVES